MDFSTVTFIQQTLQLSFQIDNGKPPDHFVKKISILVKRKIYQADPKAISDARLFSWLE